MQTKLPDGILTKLSDVTGIKPRLLSDYANGHKPVGSSRAKELEAITGIEATIWLYGTPDERKAAMIEAARRAA
ncbi:MAG TPA: hypothetical protein DCZ95_03805 [Verrucomicrobia bacterium]|nr:hypothetical protein [Verrucomicrobiota bacterium]